MVRIAAYGGCLIAFCFNLPLGHPKIDQWHGLMLAAVWVLLCLWNENKPKGLFVWLILWSIPTVIIWRDAFGIAWLWFSTWGLMCLACASLKSHSTAVREALIFSGFVQLFFVMFQVLGHPIFDGVHDDNPLGAGLYGSLGKRYLLSALFGLCSIISRGKYQWKSILWCLAAYSTSSWIGVIPAVINMLMRLRHLGYVIAVIPLLVYLAWDRIFIRLKVLKNLLPELETSVGFNALKGAGYIGQDEVSRLLGWQDYHNTFLETYARFGWWGILLLVGVAAWIVNKKSLGITIWLVVLLAGQSAEAFPALFWMIGMSLIIIGGKNALDTV